jgi:TonB family protein
VVARVLIDSSGHAEPGSIRIISTPNTGFNESVITYFQKAQFTPRTRSCVVLPVDFKIRR